MLLLPSSSAVTITNDVVIDYFRNYHRHQRMEATVAAADRFFTNRTSLFDAMPAVWQHMKEGERRQVCSLFDTFNGDWSTDNLKEVMALATVRLEDVDKLRGCYIMSKEDSSVFVDPITPEEPPVVSKKKRQWMLDQDYQGFAFAPQHLLQSFREDKKKHPRQTIGPLPKGGVGFGWPNGRNRKTAADLFCHMTNFVASNHGWRKGGNLAPSSYLDVHFMEDQEELLNPTARDIQIGAIIEQCIGKKATKKVARRRVDFVTGNVNSYARILNGPAQLEKIKSYNQLAASMAELQRERQQKDETSKSQKKKADEIKAAKKADKERDAKETHDRLLPICTEHVAKGIFFCVSLKLDHKREILKHVFKHVEATSTLRAARANRLLEDLISPTPEDDNAEIGIGLVPLLPEPDLEFASHDNIDPV